MAQVVNETDRLTFILTSYGLERVAEALADETVTIALSYIKIGDANFEYYIPSVDQTELKNLIPGGSFPIINKTLLEDNLTISLQAIFTEEVNNCEIREVGIYETVNGVDKLFAVSTQQPLLKPDESLNYLISVDYFAFLKSANLADIYDQIILNPDIQLVTQEDLDALMSTIAFTESNLMEQINGNSRVIGLNRAEQLREKVEENRANCGYLTSYNNYATLIDYIDPENIFAYWLFNYPRRIASAASLVDIGTYGRNLSCNQAVNNYDRVYCGLMPMLTFSNPNYYYLPQDKGTATYDSSVFHIAGDLVVNRNGLASGFSYSNYATAFSLNVEAGNTYAIYFNFHTSNLDHNQNIAYTTTAYSFSAYINAESSEFVVKVGNGTIWLTTLYFTIAPGTDYSVRLLFNDDVVSLASLIDDVYVEKMATVLPSPLASTFGIFTLGTDDDLYSFEGYMDLKQVALNVNGVREFSGSTYTSHNDMSLLTADLTNDISFCMAFALEPLSTGKRTLLARSNYATNANIFEVNETEKDEFELKLFADSDNYLVFKTGEKVVPKSAHSVIFSYNSSSKTVQAFIGGKKVNVFRTTVGTYNHMNTSLSVLYSFVYTPTKEIWADSDTEPTQLFNNDGTPFEGEGWEVHDGEVFYEGASTSYKGSGNVMTVRLYAWNYNDGLDDHVIYTKTLDLQEDTPLFNPDYTLYTGHNFHVAQSGLSYVIQYSTNATEYTSTMDILPRTLYNYTYYESLKTIWANDSATPTVLYNSNGDVYRGTDWTLINNIVYYMGEEATYNSMYNIAMPSVPVTSYITDSNGNIAYNINSNVGVVSVIKEEMPERYLRAIALNLEATLGNNPCTRTY